MFSWNKAAALVGLMILCLATSAAAQVPGSPSSYTPQSTPYTGSEIWYCSRPGPVKGSCSANNIFSSPGFVSSLATSIPSLLAAPPCIGCTTPGAGAFTTLTATGAGPFPVSIPKAAFDTDVLRAYCYKGDGSSHPLSTVTVCNGVNTTGFTLVQWQAYLPAATSLTNEVDWAAVQSFINSASGPISISIPPGKAFFNLPISVGANSVAFFGGGGINQVNTGTNPGSQTWWHFTGNTDGIDHTTAQNSKIELHDIMLDSTTNTGAIIAINDGSANNTTLDHVLITGFNNCLLFTNPRGTKLNDVVCENTQAAGADVTSVGLKYQGVSSFINHISNTLMAGYAIQYYFHSTNTLPTVGIEDLQVRDSACGGGWKCIIIDATSPTTYGPFNYSFTNMSADTIGYFIQATSCNNVLVQGGNWLADAAVGSWTSSLNMFDWGTSTSACAQIRMHDLWFGNLTTVAMNSLVTFESLASDAQVTGLHIETNHVTAGAWFQVASGALNIVEKDNKWFNSFATIQPPSNAVSNFSPSPTNKLNSAISQTPILSLCGTSPSLNAGADASHGIITEGSGAPTTCTLTYATALPIPQTCILQNTQSAFGVMQLSSNTQSGFVYTHSAGSLGVAYSCTY